MLAKLYHTVLIIVFVVLSASAQSIRVLEETDQKLVLAIEAGDPEWRCVDGQAVADVIETGLHKHHRFSLPFASQSLHKSAELSARMVSS